MMCVKSHVRVERITVSDILLKIAYIALFTIIVKMALFEGSVRHEVISGPQRDFALCKYTFSPTCVQSFMGWYAGLRHVLN